MPAVALCDGAASSLKAVEFAGFPNFFVNPTDQLILVHAWNPTRLMLYAGASAQQAMMRDGIPNGTSAPSSPSYGGANGGAGSGGVTTPALYGVATGMGPAEAMRHAVGTITPEVLETQRQCLPVPYVLHAHVSAMKESKALKDFLNYKVETANVPCFSSAAKSEEEGRGGKKLGPRSSAKGGKEDVPPLKIQEPTPEEITLTAASLTADYARQRAEHHKVDTMFLGVGNVMEGKAIKLGNTAEAVLRDLRAKFFLYFIKNDGFTLRHTTSLIRYVVVVTVGNGSPPPPPPPEEEEQGAGEGIPLNAEPSVALSNGAGHHHNNNNNASTQRLSELEGNHHGNHSKASASAVSALPHDASTSIPPPPPPPPPPKTVDALQDGLRAVQYALARRRPGHKDAVAVLLVVEPQTTEEAEVQHYTQVFEDVINAAPDVSVTEEEKEKAAAEAAEAGETPPPSTVPPAAEEHPVNNTEAAAPAPEAVPATGSSGPEPLPGVAAVVAATTAELSRMDEPWPPVSVFTFKSSKHVPQPTVWNSSQQVIKSLQQRKLEFAVMADSAPPPVMKTILSHNKPHVIIVPPSKV